MVYGWGDDQPAFTILDRGEGTQPTAPPEEASETTIAPTSTPTVKKAAANRSDELAATGLPNLATTLSAVGVVAVVGIAILTLSRRMVRYRSR